jgi:hypothetical protein
LLKEILNIVYSEEFIPDELLNQMIKEVIKEGKEKRGSIEYDFYRKAINIQVPGFRRGKEPPAKLWISELHSVIKKNSEAFNDLIMAWRHLHSQLSDLVKKYIKRDDFKEEYEEGKTNIVKFVDQILSAIELSEDTNCTKAELRLMIALELIITEDDDYRNEFAAGEENDSPFNEISNKEMGKWNKIINDVIKWSAFDIEWDCVNEFVKILRRIAAHKTKERVNIFEPTKQLLSKIKLREEAIKYFSFSNLKKWNIGSIPPSKIPELYNILKDFDESLSELDEWRKKDYNTREERKEISAKCDQLEQEINTKYSNLDLNFFALSIEKKALFGESEEKDKSHLKKELGEESKSGAFQQEKKDNDINDLLDQEQPVNIQVDTIEWEKRDNDEEEKEPREKQELYDANNNDNECKEVFNNIEKQPSEGNEYKNVSSRIWDLIKKGDLTAAFWLADSVEKGTPDNTTVPTWLIAAVQGAQWMLDTDYNFIQDIIEIGSNNDTSKMDLSCKLMGLSAAAIINLIAPSCGIFHWLDCPKEFRYLNRMVNYIKEFAEMRVPLLRDEFLDVRNEVDFNKEIRECIEKAQFLKDESVRQRFNYPDARKVLMYLYGSKGTIHNILQTILDNNAEKLNTIGEFLGNWEKRSFVNREIDRIYTYMFKQKTNVIAGKSRDQLLRYIDQTVKVIRKWYDLSQCYHHNNNKRDWHKKRVREFRNHYDSLLQDVENELAGLKNSSNKSEVVAAASCLHKTIGMIAWYIGVRDRINEQSKLPVASWWVSGTNNLKEALGRRLLWFPDIEHEDNGLISASEKHKVIEKLLDQHALELTVNKLFREWVKKQDYRFIDILKQAIVDSDESEELNRFYLDTLEGSKTMLRAKIQQTRAVIEQVIINGIISDEQRDEYTENITVISPNSPHNFKRYFKQLDDIQKALEKALENRLNTLSQRWKDLREQLRISSRVNVKERKRVEAFIDNEFKSKNTRVIEECLAKLSEHLERGEQFSIADFEMPSKRTIYREYNESRRTIENYIKSYDPSLKRLLSAIENSRTWSIIKYGEMPKTQVQQAGQVIKTWTQLMRNMPSLNDSKFVVMIKEIFSFIGFVIDRKNNFMETIKDEGNWRLIRVKMSSSDFARPFPQLGSMTNGIYDVVCIWERPGADTIGGLLHDSHLEARNIIILYFGRMTAYQMNELRKMTRKRKMVVAVLDELLLVYLTGIRRERLKTFFHCSLPLSAINPYTPSIAGDVPPEMFYGRDEIVQDLQRQDGGCLVYGGRQMGKSALLRHVMRRFHNPKMNMFAWVEDIKHVGDMSIGSEASQIWLKLRDIFVNLKLIKSKTTNSEKIKEQILQYMKENNDSRVLIMFDEADNFLNEDSRNKFREVDGLRSLMIETSRRFKVVFAGLHNVQRFQNLPNQPLAHFGYPNLVGPLESADAVALVREPLEALGFSLDEACVFCILSYTNYHPGLIQIFCHELLKRLYNHGKTNESKISLEEIEAVYLNEEVRAKIRERFEWTLALDPRYQLIAWSMIVEQIHTRDSYSQTYNAGDLLELAKYWWPSEFSKMAVDNFRNLLNEMCGLGILVLTSGNQYRLRSPNLVRLMGTEKDIEYSLLEFSDKTSSIEKDPDSFHILLNKEEKIFSPLTFSQIRNINNSHCDVGVITASKALGITRVEDTLKKLVINVVNNDNQSGVIQIPQTIHDPNKFYEWLKQMTKKSIKMSEVQLTAYQFTNGHAKGLDERIKSAQSFIKNFFMGTKKKGLRVYFIVDPAAYWEWLRKDSIIRRELKEQGLLIALSRWNQLGIYHMLDLLGKLNNEATCNKLLNDSGGWPIILEAIMERLGNECDPRQVSDDVKKELISEGKLKKDFIEGLGILTDTRIIDVIKYLKANPYLSDEYVTPELIESDSNLTNEDCIWALDFLKQFGLIDLKDNILMVEPTVANIDIFGANKNEFTKFDD